MLSIQKAPVINAHIAIQIPIRRVLLAEIGLDAFLMPIIEGYLDKLIGDWLRN